MASPVECPALDTGTFSITSLNRTEGAAINVTCSAFGHRVIPDSARSLLCNTSGVWDPPVPECQWTWEFTTDEKVILGTAVGCTALVIIVIIVTVISCCCCRRRQHEKASNELMHGDNPGYAPSPGDTGGVYPDAYFAYQEYAGPKNNMNGAMDRAWLGYIPRPKVEEARYYH